MNDSHPGFAEASNLFVDVLSFTFVQSHLENAIASEQQHSAIHHLFFKLTVSFA
jgi:hypothetical protein